MSKLILYTDGGSRGNPGPGALGVVIKIENEKSCLPAGKVKMKKEYSKYLGKVTNNQAEYEAIIFGLQKAKGIIKSKKLPKREECFLDSELVVEQINHQYKIKNQGIQPLFIKVWNLTLDFDKVTFKYVPREENKEADRLVNKVLDSKAKENSLPGV